MGGWFNFHVHIFVIVPYLEGVYDISSNKKVKRFYGECKKCCFFFFYARTYRCRESLLQEVVVVLWTLWVFIMIFCRVVTNHSRVVVYGMQYERLWV